MRPRAGGLFSEGCSSLGEEGSPCSMGMCCVRCVCVVTGVYAIWAHGEGGVWDESVLVGSSRLGRVACWVDGACEHPGMLLYARAVQHPACGAGG